MRKIIKNIALLVCLMFTVASLHSAEWTYFNNKWETFKPVDSVSGYQFTKELNNEVDALLYRVNKFPKNIFKDKRTVGNNIAKFLKEHPDEYARTWEVKDGKFLIMVIAYAYNGKYVTLLFEETVEDMIRMWNETN